MTREEKMARIKEWNKEQEDYDAKHPEEAEKRERANIENLRERGFIYAAKYSEMFGYDRLCPYFINGHRDTTEKFYKKCVEEGNPWDYYCEKLPPGSLL